MFCLAESGGLPDNRSAHCFLSQGDGGLFSSIDKYESNEQLRFVYFFNGPVVLVQEFASVVHAAVALCGKCHGKASQECEKQFFHNKWIKKNS